ncbi:MAG: Methyltransferase type 11 [Parcubacteria group bacterium GW2011_GWB1_41_4]|nr:MAG: Methyltransferase type 11 [Parcubacteria group bacterium GW2011_GWB1_41_4]
MKHLNYFNIIKLTIMIDIKKIIQESEIKAGDRVADFGAGSGFIATEIAKTVGEKGELIAIDILAEPLEVIESKSKHLGLMNIRTIKSDLEKENGSTLEANSTDAIMISNLLFQIERPEIIIKEAERISKQGGKIIAVEWLPEKMVSQGGNFSHSPQEIKKLFEGHGLNFVKEFVPGPNHYGLIYQK